MKRNFTFLKTLLVAVGLLGGTGAWADGTKRTLEIEDYENAVAADWTSPSGSVTFVTGDATYGNYVQVAPSGSGNRSCYKSVTFDYEPTGYTTSAMTAAGYNIEFDFLLRGGDIVERSVSQFIVPTTGPNLATNAAYTGSDYIFALSQPSLAKEGVNAGIQAGKNGTASNTWYINDLTNATTTTIDLNRDTWYHVTLVVTATSVDYTITNNSTSASIASGSKTVASLAKINGFFDLLGRGNGQIRFDNLEIYDYTEEVTVTAPTFTFKKVDGEDRIYTLVNPNGSGKLYYTTAPAESAPAVGDAAYTSTSANSLDVTYSTSGNYYAYVLHSNETTASAVISQAVTAGELTLEKPVFTITDMVQAADGFYYPQVTFTSDNSSKEGAPTATFDVSSPYTFTATGSITVTASADGYTSSSNTFIVTNAYVKSKTIDFGALIASDFDDKWESATGAPRDYWTNRAAAIPADVTYYKLIDKTAETSNTALSGITISNASVHDPQVYIGYGLLTPYYQGVSGNTMNLTVNGATAEDYAVYNGWNNYGSGTFNTVQAGNANFGLYRYDTMLRNIKVYSPVPATVSATINSTYEYASFSSTYALDFTNVSGLTAWIATGSNGDYVTLGQVTGKVAAGTGLILNGASADIPVVASGTDYSETNKLFAVTSNYNLGAAGDGYTNYVLAWQNDNVVFAPVTGTNKAAVQAGQAALCLPTSGAANALNIVFGDETNGVEAIKSNVVKTNNYYNLNGQRVVKPSKGLYIVNGKKVIVK